MTDETPPKGMSLEGPKSDLRGQAVVSAELPYRGHRFASRLKERVSGLVHKR